MYENEIIVSFCIPVFNQLELVKKCINSIIEYKGIDIEVIVNDDCSDDNIEELVRSIGDKRIKYYQNEKNLGHDLNIIRTFMNAKGKYAFLLRSRDYIIAKNIGELLKAIRRNVGCSYLLSSALDEEGKFRYQYQSEYIRGIRESIDANYKLIIHPSGGCYSLKEINLQRLYSFTEKNIKGKYGFVVHSLVRQELALHGKFVLIEKPVWVYVYTEKQDDIAENKAQNGVSVYDPQFSYMRFLYELKWSKLTAQEKYRDVLFINIYKTYLSAVTWNFYVNNKSKAMQRHYGYRERSFSVSNERRKFQRFALDSYSEEYGESLSHEYLKKIDMITLQNKYISWVPAVLRRMLFDTKAYKKIGMIYRKIVYRFS